MKSRSTFRIKSDLLGKTAHKSSSKFAIFYERRSWTRLAIKRCHSSCDGVCAPISIISTNSSFVPVIRATTFCDRFARMRQHWRANPHIGWIAQTLRRHNSCIFSRSTFRSSLAISLFDFSFGMTSGVSQFFRCDTLLHMGFATRHLCLMM